MRLAACLVLALVVAGVAVAARGDPQKRFTPADQARAKAMLLRQADVGADFKASKSSGDDFDFYCKALDESDLVLTGEAKGLDFQKEDASRPQVLVVSSLAQVYETVAQSAESWRRGTSAAGVKCAELGFRRGAKEEGWTFVSLRKLAFPRLAPQTVAFRVTFEIQGVRMIVDLVVLRNGRAQAGPMFFGVPSAYPRSEEVRLARIVARRMAEAMHGA